MTDRRKVMINRFGRSVGRNQVHDLRIDRKWSTSEFLAQDPTRAACGSRLQQSSIPTTQSQLELSGAPRVSALASTKVKYFAGAAIVAQPYRTCRGGHRRPAPRNDGFANSIDTFADQYTAK